MAADVIFCTESFHRANRERFLAVAPEAQFVLLAADADEPISAADAERITIGFFSADAWPDLAPAFMSVALSASNMKWFHTMSAGTDHPIFQSFIDNGAALTKSPGASAGPIAGTVMMYLLALSRDLPRMMRAQARAEWEWERWNELAGRTVAVLGWGPIGQNVARLASAHGMDPVVVRRAAAGDEPFPVQTLDELEHVVSQVDAVVVALPLTERTRGLVSSDVLAAMRPGALFVNVGRGELVDQDALVDALRTGRLGGAGLDVTVPEPLPPEHPLWALENVIITPHNSGSTVETEERAAGIFFTNLARWIAGDELMHRVWQAGGGDQPS